MRNRVSRQMEKETQKVIRRFGAGKGKKARIDVEFWMRQLRDKTTHATLRTFSKPTSLLERKEATSSNFGLYEACKKHKRASTTADINSFGSSVAKHNPGLALHLLFA